jgi:hypothetical protein
MKRNLFRRTLALLLSLAMLISVGTLSALADGETTPSGWWSAYATTSWYNDTSTTFTLTTAEQLAGLAELVNAGNTFANKTIRLGKDIDLSAHYWVPIGGNRGVSGGVPTGYSFAGTFDGGRVEDGKIINYSITGLHIQWNLGDTRPDDGTKVLSGVSYGGFGLFGKATGTIENVTISGSITSDATVIAVGGVVGYTTGNLYNCNSQVMVQCSNTASAQIGGVAGEVYNHAIRLIRHVQYCVNTGAVTGGQQVGGIVGEADCYPLGGIVIDNCANTGNITTVTTSGDADVGGIVGFSEGFLTNSYSIATMTSSGGSRVAGLVGQLRAQNPEARVNNCYTIPVFKGTTAEKFSWIYGTVNSSNSLPIKNVLWCDAANTSSGVSGVTQTIATGNNQQGYWTDTGTATNAAMMAAATGLATVYSSTGTTYTTDTTKTVLGVLGNAFTVSSNLNNGYPVLDWEATGLTTGKEDDTRSIGTLISGDTYTDALPGMVYTIYDVTDMNTLAGYVNAGKPTEGVIFRLMNDIDLSDTAWAGIGNPVLASASTNSPYVSSGNGLDGVLDGNGKTVKVSRSATTGGIGGVVNYLMPAGTIVDLTVSGSVTSTVGSSGNAVGGVVGYNSGTIQNVTNTATVKAEECYNVGGITGFNNGYYGATGTFSSDAKGFILNSANSGTITGFDKVGGIAGENAGTIEACSNTGAVNGKDASRSGIGGITGRNGNNDTATETGIIRNCYNWGAISSGTADDASSRGRWVGGIAGFQNSLSSCTNCYNIGALVGYKDVGNTVGSDDNEATEGVINCYGQEGISHTTGNTNDSLVDDGTISLTRNVMLGNQDAEINDVTAPFLTFLSAGTTDVWTQVNGSYPTLLGATQAANFLIQMTSQPTKLSYTVGETFDTAGMVIKAIYTDGSEVAITNYAINPSGALSLTDSSVVISGVYQSVPFTFAIPITVTGAAEIYLDGTATTNGNGTAVSPYNDLTDAVNAAGSGGTIVITGTVTLTGGDYYDSVTFKRGGDLTGPLFIVHAPNNEYGIAYVTMTNATVDGNGFATLFEVTEGRLRLRGSIKLQNADVGVNVTGNGQVEVNYATIATSTAIQLADADTKFILDSFGKDEDDSTNGGDIAISGIVDLGEGGYITVESEITSNLTVKCDAPTNGTVIAEGSGYTLTSDDASHISYQAGAGYSVTLSDSKIVLQLITPIYLDGTATTNGTGTATNPYNSLTSALNAATATGAKIIVTGTVTITDKQEFYDNVTFERGFGLQAGDSNYGEPLFVINAPDSDVDDDGTLETTYVTMSTATINGGGVGTAISVTQGRLRLRGGITVEATDVAVNVSGNGQVELNNATISASQYSVKVAGSANTFILNSSGSLSITGTIYLGEGDYITTYSALTCDLKIECAYPRNGLEVVTGNVPGGTDYTLTDADKAKVSYVNGYCAVTLNTTANQIQLTSSKVVYLNGTATSNGNGTYGSPYNNLTSALANSDAQLIIVLGTTDLSAEAYSGTKPIQRGASLTGPMFTVNSNTVTLSGMTINGCGVGIIISVNGGTLTLEDGATLTNCETAVAVGEESALTVMNAVIAASQYSIKLEADSSMFTLDATAGTSIAGTVFLGTDAFIIVERAIPCNIVIECEDAFNELPIAVAENDYAFTDADAEKVSYHDGTFDIVVVDDGEILALSTPDNG